MEKQLTPEQFRKMQLAELDMLVEFDRICRLHNIKYVIWGGTLLGAIRHEGFIPWDGDVDVAMLRDEYTKFTKIKNELNPDLCWFQDHDTDNDYPWGYGKLRKTGTVYVRTGQEHLKCKTGLFIDIFPHDDIPKAIPLQIIQDFLCFCLRKIQYAEIGQYGKDNKLLYSILAKIPRNFSFKCLKWFNNRSHNNTPNKVRTLTYTSIGKLYYKHSLKERYGMPKDWFLKTVDVKFEGRLFPVPVEYDKCLTFIFGDYMTPPPENKRELHTPASDFQF